MSSAAKPLWGNYDNRMDRLEVHGLLQRIPPALRVRWLRWCCTKCFLPGSTHQPVVTLHPSAVVRQDGENPMEVYFDFWALVNQYRLNPAQALEALVYIVRSWERGHFRKGSPVHLHLPR